MKLVLLDSYDSFTWNLADYLVRSGAEVEVIANDATHVHDSRFAEADGLVLSPGPKRPEDAGILMDVIRCYVAHKPILGVCLGHQALGMHFGLKLIEAPEPVHGRTSHITHRGRGLFEGLGQPLEVMRYHSLVLQENEAVKEVEIEARTPDGLIMALKHTKWPVFGVQFHPESILTSAGLELLKNWTSTIKKLKKS